MLGSVSIMLATALGGIGSPAPQEQCVEIVVTPAAAGRQLLRASIPFPRGTLLAGKFLRASDGQVDVLAAVRVLTWHPRPKSEPRSARRAMVTFPYTFKSTRPVRFRLTPTDQAPAGEVPVKINVSGDEVLVNCARGPSFATSLTAPKRESAEAAREDTVESNAYFLWKRFHLADEKWPRVIEVRADAMGTVAVVAHVRRHLPGDEYAPELGWRIACAATQGVMKKADRRRRLVSEAVTHSFADESACETVIDGNYRIYHPAAPVKKKGEVSARLEAGRLEYIYTRCKPEDKVPMQSWAWRRIEFVVGPDSAAKLTVTLEYPHRVDVDRLLWDAVYATGEPRDLKDQPKLEAILKYHRDAIVRSVAHGHDWGNVTSYSDSSQTGSAFGMNRLNHCPPMFFEGYRSGERRLIEAAVLWCDNMHDLSIWWGAGKTGGTRYNNATAHGEPAPLGDTSFMWRSNKSVSFCTKGYDSFFIAYEQTGDPRMKEALDAQVAYASEHVTADRETRNVGDVRDFIRLYGYTGEKKHLDNALRLFRELRQKLSTGDLFDQGGRPLDAVLPFIDNDAVGSNYGYAKPYIIGYALCGLPELIRHAPKEPKLKDVVKAVADFLADSQDPLGGWRYPHPRSSNLTLSQAIEHAWQIVQVDRALGAQEKHLDAIERVLRQRILGWQKTGQMFAGLAGWERATGKIKPGDDLRRLYARPEDRDFTKDYTEGSPSFGGGPPEGIVYFFEILDFYLKHRPASRLLEAPKPDEPLGIVLSRVHGTLHGSDSGSSAPCGVKDNLPLFADKLAERLKYPMSWLSGNYKDFEDWKKTARAKVMGCLLPAPPDAPFDPKIIAVEDRGTYVAQKIELSITADSRVVGYMLVPKSAAVMSRPTHLRQRETPSELLPAVLLLHDHGARFDIGKEKVVKPFDCPPKKLASANEWVDTYYGGRFIGDELAKRGYVCFATDALNWSDRGGAGYEGQQALAGNLFHLGTSFAGLIAHEDLRAAEFLATRSEVDPERVAAVGLSMGCFRTWQVAALSDRISAGAAICWMAAVKGLMVPGNNQTGGQSAYTMIHPGLSNYLDFPDVASIACPKPMLFYNGLRDGLFPIPSVKDAYAKMRKVWESQNAGDKLVTRLWDVPHQFNREMQEEAFAWLDVALGK